MAENTSRKPEWAPEDDDGAYATRIVPGAGSAPPLGPRNSAGSVKTLTVDDYVSGVLGGDRAMLARAITLIESNAPAHFELSQAVLQRLQAHAGGSIRVGITGVPGSGKSTLIESLGRHLVAEGRRIAVLAIDPSSSVTGGSILGDKTRMTELSRSDDAFIRPSPAGGILGGVARKTRETIVVCEAAGFDVILLETVGTGQSEVTARSLVDFFLLVLIAGAGDELQGIKRGVIELVDAIAINKADGDNRPAAELARAQTNRVLSYISPATPGWRTRAVTTSALTGVGVQALWATVSEFVSRTQASGEFEERRRQQAREWLRALIDQQLRERFYALPAVAQALSGLEQQVANGEVPVTAAAMELLRHFGAASET